MSAYRFAAMFLLALVSILAAWATANERNQIDCKRTGGRWEQGIVNDYCR